MDFDNRKVYGDTFISDGLVLCYMHPEQVIWSGISAHIMVGILGVSYLVLPEHSVESDCLV